MIQVELPPPCQEMLEYEGLVDAAVKSVINQYDLYQINTGLMDRMTVLRWIGDDELLFVDGVVTDKDVSEESVEFRVVCANVVLRLKPQLPAGSITRDLTMPEVLEMVARSFGRKLAQHEDDEHQFVYTGSFEGHLHVDLNESDGSPVAESNICITAGVDVDGGAVSAWAFDGCRYRPWFDGQDWREGLEWNV